MLESAPAGDTPCGIAEEHADDTLVLVDLDDRAVGTASKIEAHRGRGLLHRAFSIFIFDDRGRVLLQQRAAGKPLWPHYWSNACCSHPRVGEEMSVAVQRRLGEELGLRCAMEFLFKFHYQAQYDAMRAENELCSVFAGRSNAWPAFNRSEIGAIRYVAPDALDEEVSRRPDAFTPWFKIEWQRMRVGLRRVG
ncbi:MAG TPA: isopentenyl-diphosphate Delta-isomerase [Rhodanobacteraceae bacterium]